MSTSIIVPLFNQWSLTKACVDSVLDTADDAELVLVDNGSTDDTRHEAEADVVVRFATNRGFAAGCNAGARVASGDRLVFLNNDTVCHPGWLEPLVTKLERPVGVTGARLVYPDGSLQHAGVGLRKQRGILEAYNILDEQPGGVVDAVTGACLAVRRDLFEALGGFDEGYYNGYEDVDFCLRVRMAGWSVEYVPASTVTHLESASGPERWRAVQHNVRRLNERWGRSHG